MTMPDESKYDLKNKPTDRLRYLADFIRGLKDKQLYMPAYSKGIDCGTARCAIGWAVTLPALQEVGCPKTSEELHSAALYTETDFFGIAAFAKSSIWLPGGYPQYFSAWEIPASAVADRLHEAADEADATS